MACSMPFAAHSSRPPAKALPSRGLQAVLCRQRIFVRMFQPGQTVRVNLAGMEVQGVHFHAAVTDAVGTIVRQTSTDPPRFLVRLLFSFRGVNEVEVPVDRIKAG